MKKVFLSVLVIFVFVSVADLAASSVKDEFFSNRDFVKNLNDAKLEDHNALTAKMSPFIKIMRDRNIPNCFECSLYLIKSTLDSDGAMQLVAADLAVKFSPDLPEAHLHYLMRLLKYSPFSGGRMLKVAADMSRTFFNFPPRDAFFYSILDRISKGCVLFLTVFFFIMFFKYYSAIIHRYMHLVGFSRFYAFSLLVAIAVSSVILSSNELSWLIVLITFTMFFSGVSVLREKMVMHTVLAICVLAEAAIILTGVNESATIDKEISVANLKAVYSPVFAGIDSPETDVPGGSMAKGTMFYYSGNYNRAAFYFKRELNSVTDRKIKASIDNFLGLSFARQGNFNEAVQHLKASYESTKDFKIGYNLARILYESGKAGEATAIEKYILENAGAITLSFPYHYYPEMYRVWRYMSAGKTGESLEVWVRFFLFIAVIIMTYIVLLMVRMNYLGKIKLDKCLECGAVICSSCNPGSNTYSCVVCRLMKAKPELFKKGENIVYENERNGYFAKYSMFTTIFTFITPGGGLVFSDRVVEGSVYLFIILFLLTQILQSDLGMVYNINPGSTNVVLLVFGIIAGLIYLLSVLRGFFASRNM